MCSTYIIGFVDNKESKAKYHERRRERKIEVNYIKKEKVMIFRARNSIVKNNIKENKLFANSTINLCFVLHYCIICLSIIVDRTYLPKYKRNREFKIS